MAVTDGMSEKQSNPIPVVDVIIEEDSMILFARRKRNRSKVILVFQEGLSTWKNNPGTVKVKSKKKHPWI